MRHSIRLVTRATSAKKYACRLAACPNTIGTEAPDLRVQLAGGGYSACVDSLRQGAPSVALPVPFGPASKTHLCYLQASCRMGRNTVAAVAVAVMSVLVSWVINWTHTSELSESPRARCVDPSPSCFFLSLSRALSLSLCLPRAPPFCKSAVLPPTVLSTAARTRVFCVAKRLAFPAEPWYICAGVWRLWLQSEWLVCSLCSWNSCVVRTACCHCTCALHCMPNGAPVFGRCWAPQAAASKHGHICHLDVCHILGDTSVRGAVYERQLVWQGPEQGSCRGSACQPPVVSPQARPVPCAPFLWLAYTGNQRPHISLLVFWAATPRANLQWTCQAWGGRARVLCHAPYTP